MSDNKPKPIPRKTPGAKSEGGKKEGGMTMREQIAARKQAEQGGDSAPAAAPKKAAAPKAVARKAGKPAPVKKAAPKPAAKPAAKGPVKADAKAASKPEAKVAGKAEGSRPARPSSRSSAGRAGGAKGRRGKDEGSNDDNGGTTRGRRSRPEPKKKSPIPMIAAGVIVLGGAGAYFGGVFDSDPADAAENTTEEATAGDAGAETAGDTAADLTAATSDIENAGADGEPNPAAVSDGAEAPAGDQAATVGEGDNEAATADEAAPEKAAKKEKSGPTKNIDLSTLEPHPKPVSLGDEEWATLQEKAAAYFDPFGGAAGGRAEKKLIEAGQMAWPAILNELIKIDVDDPEGNRMGFRATLAMSRARGSESPNGFDWRSAQDSASGEMKPVDLYFNKRLVVMLHEAWGGVIEDPERWSMFDKTDVQAEANERAAAKAKEEAGEFDDLDLDDLDID